MTIIIEFNLNDLIARYMKHEFRHLSFLCADLDCGNICPACPKVSVRKA